MNSRKRNNRGGCLMNILTVLFVLVTAAALGWFAVRRYMPSNEMMDKSALFGVKENQVALVLMGRKRRSGFDKTAAANV